MEAQRSGWNGHSLVGARAVRSSRLRSTGPSLSWYNSLASRRLPVHQGLTVFRISSRAIPRHDQQPSEIACPMDSVHGEP